MRSRKWHLTGCWRIVSPDWFDRYVHRFALQRFPKEKSARETLRNQVGEDSWHLLQAATK